MVWLGVGRVVMRLSYWEQQWVRMSRRLLGVKRPMRMPPRLLGGRRRSVLTSYGEANVEAPGRPTLNTLQEILLAYGLPHEETETDT